MNQVDVAPLLWGQVAEERRRVQIPLARQEPQVKHILTSNSETNGHMIGINDRVNVQVLDGLNEGDEVVTADSGG